MFKIWAEKYCQCYHFKLLQKLKKKENKSLKILLLLIPCKQLKIIQLLSVSPRKALFFFKFCFLHIYPTSQVHSPEWFHMLTEHNKWQKDHIACLQIAKYFAPLFPPSRKKKENMFVLNVRKTPRGKYSISRLHSFFHTQTHIHTVINTYKHIHTDTKHRNKQILSSYW